MLRLLWIACWVAALGVLGCGGDDDDDHGGTGGAAVFDGGTGASRNGGSGGRAANGSGGSGHVSTGTGGMSAGGSGSGGAGAGGAGSGGASAGSGGTSIDVTSPTARTAACLEYVNAYCESQLRCAAVLTPDMLRNCIWGSANTCPDLIFADGSSRTVTGTIECAQAWRDESCTDRTAGVAPSCATSGTLPAGAKCISGFQCESRGCGNDPTMCGTCHALATDGGACDATHDCPEGDRCLDAVCTPIERVDAGAMPQPAPELGLGDACDRATTACGSIKYDCLPDANGEGHCVPFPQLGEDCSVSRTCEFFNSYCDLSLKCLAFPIAGQPCGKDGWTGVASWCAAEDFCDSSVDPPVCHLLPAAGESCSGPCAKGLTCTADAADPSMQKCLRQRMPGESCSDPGDRCLPGATRCDGGVCALVEWQGLTDSWCKP